MKRLGHGLITCWFVLICHHACAEQRAATSVTIKAKGVDTRDLIHVLADSAKLHLAIGDELTNHRINIDQTNADPVTLIEHLASQQGLAVKRSGKLLLIASKCRLAQVADIPDLPGLRELISFNFYHVDAGTLVGTDGILHSVSNLAFDSASIDGATGLTLMVWDGRLRDELQAIATVEGWDVSGDALGGMKITPGKAVAQCQAEAGNRKLGPVTFAALRESPACPDPEFPKCEMPERYELSQIATRGWIKSNASPTPMALIDIPDVGIVTIKTGHYMGRNLGKVLNISDKGITIEEYRDDGHGDLKKVRLLLPYR